MMTSDSCSLEELPLCVMQLPN